MHAIAIYIIISLQARSHSYHHYCCRERGVQWFNQNGMESVKVNQYMYETESDIIVCKSKAV